MRPTRRSCASRLLWLGNTIRRDMRPETPGRPRSRRLIASRQRSTARSRATAKIPLCGGQTPSGPKDRCRSARRRLRMSGVGTDLIRHRIVRSGERTWHSSTDGTRTGLTRLLRTIGALATSIPGSELDDRAKSCWLAWRYIRGESYTIADFATARRHRCFGDRRYLTSAPDSAQLWLIHLPIPHSPFSILTMVHSLGTNNTSAALCPAAFLRRGCCA